MKRNNYLLRLIIVPFCFAFAILQASAQQLTVAPAHLVCDYKVPDKVDTQVKSKLQRALAEYGISSDSYMARFSMVPSVSINNEQTKATIPPKCDLDFDLVISLQDIYSGKVFSTFTCNTMSTGNNKANAIALGISKIKLNDGKFSSFINESKSKVISYYETQMSAIIAKAQTAAKMRNFDEAIFILGEIPEECPSYNQRVAPLIQEYYKKDMDLFGEKLLAEARAAWAASPNAEGAARVAEILADMPPSCSSSAAAKTFVGQIGNKVSSLEAWERKFLEKEQAYRHDERKATISAARAIGVAFARNQPRPIYRVNIW